MLVKVKNVRTHTPSIDQIRLIEAIELSMAYLVFENRMGEARKLNTVYELLPDYPVMAVMEAEAGNVHPDIIAGIRQVFGVVEKLA